ncbi:MAG: chemotaxis protein CheA, partial [Bacteroidia bacterium]
MAKEEEYKELFLAEAQENHEQLNNLFTELEKDIASKTAVDAIFRITHTLKGNAMGMGFSAIAELSHVMEDVFNEVKLGRLKLDLQFFNSLFKANDTLGQLINAIQSGESVKYIGIKTKLEVALRNALQNTTAHTNEPSTEKTEQPVSSEDIISATNLPFAIDATQQVEDEDDYEGEDPTEQKITISDMVQVPVRKLDYLLNIIGELIIERDALIARHTDRGHKLSELARLQRITSDLQFGVMDIRLVQIGFLFSKFHRIVRDVATLENKKVDLVLEGTDIEIDRNILRIMSDSLVHLVRNSVSHGIESPEERIRLGKPETGKVTLAASSEKDTVYIHVTDDGKGIDVQVIKRKALEKGIISPDFAKIMDDDEVLMCLFEPGFSSAEIITEVS